MPAPDPDWTVINIVNNDLGVHLSADWTVVIEILYCHLG